MAPKRPATNSNSGFQFVTFNGPQAREDPSVRTLIRRQAMKEIGRARRRRVGPEHVHGEHGSDHSGSSNVNDPPSDVSSSISPGTTTSDHSASVRDDVTEPDDRAVIQLNMTVSVNRSAALTAASPLSTHLQTAYEAARSKFSVDIGSLSILTNFNMGKTAIPFLSTDPGRFASLMELRQWSYLDYVPIRYGVSPCVAAATDCVLAKVRSVLRPDLDYSNLLWNLYAKALRCIQDAIATPKARKDADLLCAMQLMCLHELLDVSHMEAWSHHTNGSARLIMHRSPDMFKDDFEKALLATHAGAIVSEAMMNTEHCYLAQPQWMETLATLAEETDTLTERSPLILNIRLQMLYLPGLWHDLHALMTTEQIFDNDATQALEKRCIESHDGFIHWMDEYNAHCVRTSFLPTSSEELELRREVFGAVCECLLLLKRFWACLNDAKRLQLEMETQALAKLILSIQAQGAPRLSWLFSVHEVEMARAAIATQEAFEEDSRQLSAVEQRLASRKRYLWLTRVMRTGKHYPVTDDV